MCKKMTLTRTLKYVSIPRGNGKKKVTKMPYKMTFQLKIVLSLIFRFEVTGIQANVLINVILDHRIGLNEDGEAQLPSA